MFKFLKRKRKNKVMAAIDDLNNAITTLSTSVSGLVSAIAAAGANSTPNAAIETAVANLGAINTTVVNETASLTPAPAPVTPVA